MNTTSHIWTNLDFEYELRHGEAWQAPKPVAHVMDVWRTLLRCLPGADDASPWDGTSPVEHLVCWGDSRRALVARGCSDIDGRLASVIQANDKRTSHAIASHEALPYSALVSSTSELDACIARCPHDWIVKHPLGVSGRERIMGRAHTIEPRHARWATRQFASAQELLFEPKVQIDREFSWHVNILHDGEVEVLGQCTLLADTQGTHRGHIVEAGARATRMPDRLIESMRALHARTGYTGPLSSDGFVGRLGEEEVYREVSEFNARLTFGRVALELTRAWADTAHVAWWHPSASTRGARTLAAHPGDSAARGWFRLPEHIDPAGRSGSALCVWEGSRAPDGSEIARSWDAL